MAHVYTVLMGTNNNLHAIKTALFTTDQIASDPDLALDVADLWMDAFNGNVEVALRYIADGYTNHDDAADAAYIAGDPKRHTVSSDLCGHLVFYSALSASICR